MAKSNLEYRLYAQFPSNSVPVRIGVFLSERACQKLGDAMHEFADDVYYKIEARNPNTKPYRKPKRRKR